ncbi:MAG: response regulator [Nitrospirae bacterium]|nr:response regulator [Nitrospirota bacterium]MBF0541798.1 response regulator [Nitrospirota bacterium]
MTKKLKILILDDEEIVGKRLAPTLRKYGCEVEVFLNPIEGLKRFDEMNFDIVVTDIRMKEMNGLEVLKHIRQKNDNTKIIVITGYAMVDTSRKAMELGAFDFIAKPFKPIDFKEIINNAAKALGFEIDLLASLQFEG